jgi:hypothetical protein
VVTADGGSSHPYFEVQQIEEDVWLVAQIVETIPVTATYSIVVPGHWPEELCRRMANYFSEFKLASRFAVEAASELVSVSAYLSGVPSADLRRTHLKRTANSERSISINGWRTALYVALASSVWYCDVGYRTVRDAVVCREST